MTPAKLWLFRLGLAAIVLFSIEAFSRIALLVLGERALAPIEQEQAGGSASSDAPLPPAAMGDLKGEVIHPYLGYVHDMSAAATSSDPRSLAHFGFTAKGDIPFRRDPAEVAIAILGGSFAQGVAMGRGGERMLELLGEAPEMGGRRLRIVCLAMAGYKQPQQLMTLSYFLMQGATFDFVLNVDGFNDAVLPPVENARKGVAPYYPRAWYYRTGAIADDEIEALGRIAYLRAWRSDLATLRRGRPWRFCATLSLLCLRLDDVLARRTSRLEQRLVERPDRSKSYVTRGPFAPYGSREELSEDVVALWGRCSRLMAALCRSQGTRYAHFLQPNQYLEGSKPMTEAERRTALFPDHPYARWVALGYPRMRREGVKLVSDGVPFHDLTQIFRDVREPVYADSCCHLNRRGYELVGEAMAAAILEDMRLPSASPP